MMAERFNPKYSNHLPRET
jgi:hypothetical protein